MRRAEAAVRQRLAQQLGIGGTRSRAGRAARRRHPRRARAALSASRCASNSSRRLDVADQRQLASATRRDATISLPVLGDLDVRGAAPTRCSRRRGVRSNDAADVGARCVGRRRSTATVRAPSAPRSTRCRPGTTRKPTSATTTTTAATKRKPIIVKSALAAAPCIVPLAAWSARQRMPLPTRLNANARDVVPVEPDEERLAADVVVRDESPVAAVVAVVAVVAHHEVVAGGHLAGKAALIVVAILAARETAGRSADRPAAPAD